MTNISNLLSLPLVSKTAPSPTSAVWLYTLSRPLGFIVGTVILGLAALSALRVRPQTPEEEAAVKAASSIEEVSEPEGEGQSAVATEGVPTAGGEYSYRSMSDDKL